jgi:hypothetical protein
MDDPPPWPDPSKAKLPALFRCAACHRMKMLTGSRLVDRRRHCEPCADTRPALCTVIRPPEPPDRSAWTGLLAWLQTGVAELPAELADAPPRRVTRWDLADEVEALAAGGKRYAPRRAKA